MSRIVIQDSTTKGNSYLTIRRLSRLYCGYSGNTAPLGLTQSTWARFAYPSTTYAAYRNVEWEISPKESRFTYTGATPKWFKIEATCNIYKVTGASPNRNVEYQWRLNGTPIGSARGSYMNGDDSQIVSGVGEILLTTGQYIEPWIRNVENSDDCRLDNCTFIICEQPEFVFAMDA